MLVCIVNIMFDSADRLRILEQRLSRRSALYNKRYKSVFNLFGIFLVLGVFYKMPLFS